MFEHSKFKTLFEKKEVEKGKEVKLEKHDFLALFLAASSVFIPLILLFIAVLALFIFLFTSYIH